MIANRYSSDSYHASSTRRHFLKIVISSLVLGGLLFLVSCGGSDDLPPASPAASSTATETRNLATDHPVPSVTIQEETNQESEAPIVETETPVKPTITVEPSEDHQFGSPDYGVQAFLWWDPKIARRDLATINELNFNWVKQSFAWRDIEGIENGKYDWYRPDLIVDMVEEAGLNLMIRIDRQPFWSQELEWPPFENAPPADLNDFADFCGVLAERYHGRIAAYQVWNEPNLSREWGENPPNPAEYTELLKVCQQAIKAADPEAMVVSAGLAPTGTGLPQALPDTEFLQGMYDAGAAKYFDILGLNAPGYKAPPEVPPEEAESNPEYGGGRWFVFRHVEDMRQIMADNGDSDKQISILELGWTTDTVNPDYAWHAVSEEQQADYLVRAYDYAAEHWQPWIGPMFTIYIADPDWSAEDNEQWWWAITLPDGARRPAFEALKNMEK